MAGSKDYFQIIRQSLINAKTSQRENILAAAQMMGDCMINKGVVQLFGLGHGIAFSMELGFRAGGLVPFHQLRVQDLLLQGKVTPEEANAEGYEDRPDLAQKIYDMYIMDDRDMYILISNGANEGVGVEFARMVKEKGQKVILVTSKACSDASVSHHPSGKKISDYADLIIDNGAMNPDTVIEMEDGTKINQTATIVGNFLAQMICAETYRYITSKGLDCPVLLSANVKGADVHNNYYTDQYNGRVR